MFISFLLILTNCQLKDSKKLHGINSLENKAKILILKETNKNDVIKLIGRPHSEALNSDNTWIYIERVTAKGKLLKLGKNVLVTNNSLVLNFDKYGILIEKKIYNINDMNKVVYAENETINTISDQSFVNKFLASVKQKMYNRKKK